MSVPETYEMKMVIPSILTGFSSILLQASVSNGRVVYFAHEILFFL